MFYNIEYKVAMEHFKYSLCHWRTRFLILLNLNLNSHMELMATLLGSSTMDIQVEIN